MPRKRAASEAFNYSRLSDEFARLSKPAKRALINAGILNARALSTWSRKDVAALHGIGPSALPILEAARKSKKLSFRQG